MAQLLGPAHPLIRLGPSVDDGEAKNLRRKIATEKTLQATIIAVDLSGTRETGGQLLEIDRTSLHHRTQQPADEVFLIDGYGDGNLLQRMIYFHGAAPLGGFNCYFGELNNTRLSATL